MSGVPKIAKLNGEVYRNYNLSQIDGGTERNGTAIVKIEGKKLIVIFLKHKTTIVNNITAHLSRRDSIFHN